MAETVQAVLDSMVPALNDFVHLNIFTEAEVKSLVDRRRTWEYLLIRKETRKGDWLEYAAFEMNLLKLHSMRKGRAGSAPLSPSSPSQFHIEQHIHFIFTRALRKFKGDVTMWMQYIDFAKKNDSRKKLSRIYGESLQIHPHSIVLWLSSAEWEFFSNNNAKSARVVMQRALRVNPKEQQLWLQYFNLEMHYVQRMRGRREILQLEGVASKSMTENALFSGGIASIVYKNAVKAVDEREEDGLEFRLEFLRLCREFPQTEKIEREIIDSIQSDFPTSPLAYVARAQYALPDLASSLRIMDSGLSISSSPLPYRIAYLEFLRDTLESGDVPSEELTEVTGKYEEIVGGGEGEEMSPELALLQASMVLNTGTSDLTSISRALAKFKIPDSLSSPSPHLVRLMVLLSHAHVRRGERGEGLKVVLDYMRKLNPHSPKHLEGYGVLSEIAVRLLLDAEREREAENIIKNAPLGINDKLVCVYLDYKVVNEGGEGAEMVREFVKRNLMGSMERFCEAYERLT